MFVFASKPQNIKTKS